jgi:hypothetical protein
MVWEALFLTYRRHNGPRWTGTALLQMLVIDIQDDEIGGMGQFLRPIRNGWRGYNRNRANLCVESPSQDLNPIARALVYPGG